MSFENERFITISKIKVINWFKIHSNVILCIYTVKIFDVSYHIEHKVNK